MDKIYQPLELEKKWYQQWESAGYFSPKQASTPYCIMLPPPNVTGTLHMGHAFQDTIMDALIRYHRMKGHQTLWQGGTDHAGIATQMVVERQLQSQGISKHDLGREAFTQKVWQWKEQSGNTISRQMRRLGASVDWDRERFTMDEGLSDAVKEVFVRLYEENLIYRGTRLVNWDPKLKTAVSDLEVESEEEYGNLWHIRYPILNKNEYLVVATTRPETMLGDVAVAVHPEDSRYQHLIGEKVQLPLTMRLIPIIADEYVDPAFGTGCVKITPAHDFNDHEIGKRHQLEMINILTEDATINKNAPEAYQGLDRFKAREKIINDLQENGLLEKIEPHTLKVPRSERTGEIVEPYLTDQWFVKTKPLAEEAIKVVESGKIEFVPANWANSYFEWMNNIQDWCISRQIWWGHRIPAWYDENGQVYVGRNEEEVRQKYKLLPHVTLMQDKDVLDTWFSSALWPFSTLGWPENTAELKKYYPTNVLVTGFDIIFFWVARMIMMGLKFIGDVPFRQVFVTGLILDSHGQKMSKSKGNILDPLDLIDGIDLEHLVEKRTYGLMQPGMAKQIEKITRKEFPQGIPSFGTDALRFSLCAFATTNRFIRFDLSRVEGYRNFCNKIWNASRFVFMNVEGKNLGASENEREYSLADQWIWSSWQKTKQAIEEHFKTYRFDLAAQCIYDFTWNQYCDWYLELSKPILSKEESSEKQRAGTRFTLVAILEELLRAMHPLMPFITEEIWQKTKGILGDSYFTNESTSIMLQPYPEVEQAKINIAAETAIKLIQDIIIGVRNIRGEMNLSPSKLLTALYRAKTTEVSSIVSINQQIIKSLAKLEQINAIEDEQSPPLSAHILADNIEVFIPLEGAIDVDAEIKRLKKELEKHQSDFDFAQKKLNNPNFVDKANPDAVEKERQRFKTAEEAMGKLSKMLESLSGK
ncbi:MAG: valine--tRNA ligase [Gammaproteobacteria bacterium 39-13]|nr:valine--tRNA ligase [Gammaproteobacteria bacterium]OJV86938.1 MAG: valine--tRNA ligase [Gammaproteobacteria bacterium 39-13]